MPAPSQQAQPSMAHLDALAQQQGFHDYATYSAWHNKYRAQNQRQAAPPTNWMQQLYSSVPSPAMLIGKVSEAYQRATGETPR